MAAGEVIALLYEQGRTHDTDFCSDYTEELVGKLRQLATDSHKYRAKKDRKTQRSSFRDIVQYVEVRKSRNLGGEAIVVPKYVSI